MKVVPSTRVESSRGPVLLYSSHHIFTGCVLLLLWDFCRFLVVVVVVFLQAVRWLAAWMSCLHPVDLWRNERVCVSGCPTSCFVASCLAAAVRRLDKMSIKWIRKEEGRPSRSLSLSLAPDEDDDWRGFSFVWAEKHFVALRILLLFFYQSKPLVCPCLSLWTVRERTSRSCHLFYSVGLQLSVSGKE